ncbi:MAG: superoxide dismutase [Crocinitomicaceae bacterium]|nr:superoxide dismutase [Crocinitomicaceae bacterium]
MDKRTFLKTTGILGAGLILSPAMACSTKMAMTNVGNDFQLPMLEYSYSALEPAIDAMTMEIHHGKHHQAYVTNLNKALANNSAYQAMTIEQICINVKPEDTAIKNNGGGHYNHSKFWNWIKPGGQTAPSGALADALNSAFGDKAGFEKEFSEAAKSRFGSGWAWLCVDKNRRLMISSTPNQDNPLMKNVAEKTGTPILGIDVWEHAYYLHYQNRRPDYITAFLGIINWDSVAADYAAALM